MRRRSSIIHLTLVALLMGVVSLSLGLGYPKPSPVPVRWELDYEPGDLRLWRDGSGDIYWLFTYRVTNLTGEDQLWVPRLVLFTDAGDIIPSGRGVPSRAVDAAIESVGNPFLEDQNEIMGEILQGKEHARDGLVLWRAGDLDVNSVTVFVSGTSGETARVRNPITGDDIILRKTIQRDYWLHGEAEPRIGEPLELVEQQWIFR